MKKFICVITALMACASLTACSGSTESSKNNSTTENFSDVELVRTGMGNRIIADSLEKLEKYSEIAVVGEFIDNSVSDNIYEYSEHFGKEILTQPQSFNTIKVKQVLMGNVNVGDELKIGQYCGIHEGKLYSFTDLTPMMKGDEWIFFLNKDNNTGIYWCSCDSDARYPTKNSAAQNSRMAIAPNYQLGVYDKDDFNEKVYNEIVEKYDV